MKKKIRDPSNEYFKRIKQNVKHEI